MAPKSKNVHGPSGVGGMSPEVVKKTKTKNPFAHFFGNMLREKGVRLSRAERLSMMREAGERWRAMTPDEKAEWKPASPESPDGVSSEVVAASGSVELGYSAGSLGPRASESSEPAPARALESSATRFGEYVSFHGSQVLARGSYGRVITVIHERTARVAAAKVYTARPSDARMEFKVMERLTRASHPSILPALACHLSEALVWVVMPWVPTGSLHVVLKSRGRPYSGVSLSGIAEQVRGAVCHMHVSGFLHLDVKPSNILFEPTTRHAYLTDFNLAIHWPSTAGGSYTGVGPCTWPYRPHEVWRQGAASSRCVL